MEEHVSLEEFDKRAKEIFTAFFIYSKNIDITYLKQEEPKTETYEERIQERLERLTSIAYTYYSTIDLSLIPESVVDILVAESQKSAEELSRDMPDLPPVNIVDRQTVRLDIFLVAFIYFYFSSTNLIDMAEVATTNNGDFTTGKATEIYLRFLRLFPGFTERAPRMGNFAMINRISSSRTPIFKEILPYVDKVVLELTKIPGLPQSISEIRGGKMKKKMQKKNKKKTKRKLKYLKRTKKSRKYRRRI
jgi:hypothetical protein